MGASPDTKDCSDLAVFKRYFGMWCCQAGVLRIALCTEAEVTANMSELSMFLILEGIREIFHFSKQGVFGFHTLARVNRCLLMNCQAGLHLTPSPFFSLLSNSISCVFHHSPRLQYITHPI